MMKFHGNSMAHIHVRRLGNPVAAIVAIRGWDLPSDSGAELFICLSRILDPLYPLKNVYKMGTYEVPTSTRDDFSIFQWT
jgi:hypothetical protein